MNNENNFDKYYFNIFDEKKREKVFELDGKKYKFTNFIEEKKKSNEKSDSTFDKNKYVGSTLSATPRFFDSSISGINDLNPNNNSQIIKKISAT